MLPPSRRPSGALVSLVSMLMSVGRLLEENFAPASCSITTKRTVSRTTFSTRLNSSEAESAGWPLRILRFPSTSTTSKQRGAKFLTPPCTRLRLVFATSSPICLAILPFTRIAVVSLPKRRKPPSGLRLSSNLAAVGCIVLRSLGHRAKRSDQDLHRSEVQGSVPRRLSIRIQQVRGQRMGQYCHEQL